jgi:hypothetical protein
VQCLPGSRPAPRAGLDSDATLAHNHRVVRAPVGAHTMNHGTCEEAGLPSEGVH